MAPLAGVPPRARHALFGLVAVLVLANTLGTALSPYLVVEHPLFLVAISPEGRHVVLAASSVPAIPLVVVGTLRRALGLIGGFGLGLLYGEAAVRWAEERVPIMGRLIRFVERMFARFGLLLLAIVPLPGIALLAGASRTPFVGVMIAGLLGQTAWMTLTVKFGAAISNWTRPVLDFLSAHLVESTLVCAALVGLQQAFAYQRRKRARLRGGTDVHFPT